MTDAINLDDTDRQLLDLLQTDFPLAARPFAALAERLGLDETDALRRVRRLKAEGLIRQIGAIFDSRRLGYRSTLAAFRVADGALDDVAAAVSRHPGVSHNYARHHAFNLWFTLTVPPAQDVAAEVARLARETGVEQYLLLPAERTFKIGVNFRMSDAPLSQTSEVSQDFGSLTDEPSGPRHSPVLSAFDRRVIRELQADLPLVPAPFAPLAARLGLTEEELLAKAHAFRRTGVMRRFGAVLRHRRAGYRANGMGCWVVPPERCATVGRRMAQFAEVSHCYQRPAHPPDWPYRLFTMIHGHSEDEVEATARRIAQATGITDYAILYSTKEYKKERVKYFIQSNELTS